MCDAPLALAGRTLRCPGWHSFDLARQGYVDLTGGRTTHPGDRPEMVAARESLLSAGHLEAISTAVVEAVVGGLVRYRKEGLILEAGAGTGHYLARVLDAVPGVAGLAVDVSKPALRRAARAHPRLGAVRADVWRRIPVVDGAADVVLNVFAPRSGAEFARVLRAGGALVVVTAEPDHLSELVAPLGLLRVDPAKRERLAATLEPWFALESERMIRDTLRLSARDAAALVAMGPSAWHLDPARAAALPEPVTVTLAARLTVWRPR